MLKGELRTKLAFQPIREIIPLNNSTNIKVISKKGIVTENAKETSEFDCTFRRELKRDGNEFFA